MSQGSNCTVQFIPVNTNTEKQNALCRLVSDHFMKKEKVAIFVPSNEAAAYIDQLLWKQPPESFIPHAICNVNTNEPIAITTSAANVNHAPVVINLTSVPLKDIHSVKIIYELDDKTSPEKEAVSLLKRQSYAGSIKA